MRAAPQRAKLVVARGPSCFRGPSVALWETGRGPLGTSPLKVSDLQSPHPSSDVGIDVRRDHLDVCCFDADGQPSPRRRVRMAIVSVSVKAVSTSPLLHRTGHVGHRDTGPALAELLPAAPLDLAEPAEPDAPLEIAPERLRAHA